MASAVSLDATLGVMLIAVVVAAILNGVAMVQAFYYFNHQNDPPLIRFLVGTVLALDTIHQALISHTIYTYTITNFGNPASLKTVVWSNSVEVIFNALIALLVQSFLAMRVWRLSNYNRLLVGVIALFIIAQFVTIMSTFHFS